MDFNSIKEELINTIKSVHNAIVNSPVFYFIKETYNHLGTFYRKLLHGCLLTAVLCVLLYYPFSRLYSATKNMREFSGKTRLTQELVNLSNESANGAESMYRAGQDPVQFIKKRLPVLPIPKKQITKVQAVEGTVKPAGVPLGTGVKTAEVHITDLNLKELVQYGYYLEKLSDNIKMTGLNVTETAKKNNYFNVQYTLSFFSLRKTTGGKRRAKPVGGKAPLRPARPSRQNVPRFDIPSLTDIPPPPEAPHTDKVDTAKPPAPHTDKAPRHKDQHKANAPPPPPTDKSDKTKPPAPPTDKSDKTKKDKQQ